jgi:hypothetical protein
VAEAAAPKQSSTKTRLGFLSPLETNGGKTANSASNFFGFLFVRTVSAVRGFPALHA